MADKEFRVTWEADDGYCGGSRPHHFTISSDDLEEEMTEMELRELFWESMQHDFEQRVSPFSGDEEEFVEWAQEVLEARKD